MKKWIKWVEQIKGNNCWLDVDKIESVEVKVNCIDICTVSKSSHSFMFSEYSHGNNWASEQQKMLDFILLDIRFETLYEYEQTKGVLAWHNSK